MAPVPRKERRPLQLQCEWNSCSSVLLSTQDFTMHLMSHAEEFIAGSLSIEKCLADVDENDTDDYQCQWVDCGYVTNEGSAALLRHLLFHGYHTRIKWAGTVERERCKIEPCQLENHSRNIIPEVPSSFVCSWEDCSFITNNPDYFYCHVEMHSQMEEAKRGVISCRWRDCHVKTRDKYKLRDHLRSHSQEKRFGCCQCGGLFSNRTKFFDHIHRQGILDEPNYQCSHCSKVFASERLLRDHMRHHVNHYKCPFCDMTCPAPSVLKKHITWRHSSDRPFRCELCNHGAKTRTDMRRHMESHNAGDAYSCDIEDCTFTAKTLNALRTHFKRCHSDFEDKRYMCHVCQSKFTRGHILTNHLKEKHRFKWPSGHVRFRYKEHEDGFYRLQTVRYESIELTQQILHTATSTPPTATPTAPPTTLPTTTSSSMPVTTSASMPITMPLSTIQEEEGTRARASSSKRAEKSKSTRKRKSPRKKSPKKQKKNPPKNVAFQPSQVQYLEGDQGPIIIVDCTLDLKNPEGNLDHLNGSNSAGQSEEGNAETMLYDVVQLGEGEKEANNPTKNIHFIPSLPRSKVTLESGGQPISQGQYHHELNPANVRTDHQSPERNMFPIEQLQSVDAESDGERTPKKPRFEINIEQISNDGEIRSRYPGLEDDRMAMAVEAMTDLSRGYVN